MKTTTFYTVGHKHTATIRAKKQRAFVLCTIRDVLAGMGGIMVGMMLMGALLRALGVG